MMSTINTHLKMLLRYTMIARAMGLDLERNQSLKLMSMPHNNVIAAYTHTHEHIFCYFCYCCIAYCVRDANKRARAHATHKKTDGGCTKFKHRQRDIMIFLLQCEHFNLFAAHRLRCVVCGVQKNVQWYGYRTYIAE